MDKAVFPAVKAFIENENKFLVIKQVVGNKLFWDLPGGKVNFGESPYETLHREVKEETNLEVEIIKPLGMWWFFRNDGHQVVCNTFLCRPKSSAIHLDKNSDSDETIAEFQWVTKEEFLSSEYNVSHNSLKELIKKL